MSIWFQSDLTLEKINAWGKGNMIEHIGIEFTAIGENWLQATMPVDSRTRQTYGFLHGGASVTLAETVGSVASALVIDPETRICVGLEVNANHIRTTVSGSVMATAHPVHLGQGTHVWDIRIQDGESKLLCISRLTVAILQKNKGPQPGLSF